MAVSMQWKLLAAAAALAGLTLSACGGDDEPSGGDKNKNDASTNGTGMDGGVPDIEDVVAKLDDGIAGKACQANTECTGENAACAKGRTAMWGTCTGACTEDSNCGAGGKCVKPVSGADAPGFCQKLCSDSSECGSSELECRKGASAQGLADALGGLLGDSGIDLGLGDAGLSVQEPPKYCQIKVATVTLPANTAGKACTDNAGCGGGTCTKNVLVVINYPGGYCQAPCVEDSTCGAGGGCSGDGAGGQCFQKCATKSECREGYDCTTNALTGSGKYCLPAAQQNRDAGTAADAATSPDAATGAADAGVDAQ